jgi:hypothetical protein
MRFTGSRFRLELHGICLLPGTRTSLPSHCANARTGFFCALRSAILACIIPVIATPRQTGGATLCTGAETWVSSCVPHSVLGGSTSGSPEEKKGGAYDGGRHAEYCAARGALSGPLCLEQCTFHRF